MVGCDGTRTAVFRVWGAGEEGGATRMQTREVAVVGIGPAMMGA
jgi:hypothetical protein